MTNWVKLKGLAEWFGESQSTTRRKLPTLYAGGFPKPVRFKWYLPACDDWAKSQATTGNRAAPNGLDDPLMEAFNG